MLPVDQVFSSVFSQFLLLKAQNKPIDQFLLATAELLRAEISHYDWVGYYLLDSKQKMLIIGPFSGKPTEHTHIPVGKGVCGQVAENLKCMVVQDVSQQNNYIACSLDVQSEIVVPILKDGIFVAEIDIDSHAFAPFTEQDEKFLAAISSELSAYF